MLCALIRPLPPGGLFSRWPLHLTLVPWFRLNLSSRELAVELTARLSVIGRLELISGRTATLGRRTVRLILPDPGLNRLAALSRQLLQEHEAWLIDETARYRPRIFRPHVSDQGNERLAAGVRLNLTRLEIIEQTGEAKLVAARVWL